jgi:hypothetical protein
MDFDRCGIGGHVAGIDRWRAGKFRNRTGRAVWAGRVQGAARRWIEKTLI